MISEHTCPPLIIKCSYHLSYWHNQPALIYCMAEKWKLQECDFGDGRKGKDRLLQWQFNLKLAEMNYYYNQSYCLLEVPP